MSKKVKFRDSVSFEPVFDQKVKDFYQDPNQQVSSLRVRVAATHAGKITRNNGFYLPHKMREGAESFTAQYPKPIQVHHESHQDPVGRVVSARYVDISQGLMDAWDDRKICDDKRPIENTALKDFCDGKLSDEDTIKVADEHFLSDESIVDDPDYQGLGYIELIADITDPEAIRKVLDKRYLTGSIGASTDSAVCSICKENWAGEDGPCEHRPGKVYDGKKCVLIAGNLEYEEWSFVNSPADTHSSVISIDSGGGVHDSVEVDDCTGKSEEVSFEVLDHNQDSKQEDQSKEETNMLELKDKKQEEQPAPPTDEVKDEVQTDEDPKATEDKLPVEDSVPPVETGDDSPAKPVEDAADGDVQPSEEDETKEVEDNQNPEDDATQTQDEAASDADVEDEADKDVADKGDVEDEAKTEDETADVVEPEPAGLGDMEDDALLKLLEDVLKAIKERELDCVSCSENEAKLQERLDALKKELKFLLEDADVLNSQLADLVQANRSMKAEKFTNYSALAGEEVLSDEFKGELEAMSNEDLDRKLNDVTGKVDIMEITDKINSGLSNNPQGTVENPVVTVDDNEDKTKKDIKLERATLEQIRDHYFALSFRSQVLADKYLADLKARGILPKGGFQIEDKS
jgi:hypothetical protein